MPRTACGRKALTGVADLDTDGVIFGNDNYHDDAARRRVTHTIAQVDQFLTCEQDWLY